MQPSSPAAAVWNRVLKQAHDGNPRHLLELLLVPVTEDGQGNPIDFYPLPNDAELRQRIVRTLMLGPWKSAQSLGELMTKTGWGKRSKPALSDLEVSYAAMRQIIAPERMDDHAAALGVEPETLQKKIKARKSKR